LPPFAPRVVGSIQRRSLLELAVSNSGPGREHRLSSLGPVCRVYTKPAIRLRRSRHWRYRGFLGLRPCDASRSGRSLRRGSPLSRPRPTGAFDARGRPSRCSSSSRSRPDRALVAPDSRRSSTTGPKRTRTSRSTSSPSASQKRRTSRLRPSAMVISSSDVRFPSGRAVTARGSTSPSSSWMPRRAATTAARTSPRTVATYVRSSSELG